jgi:peptidoglycan hydrolase-like protein with peptidoglycan-binding domain
VQLPVLQQGSTGQAVVHWQKIVGATADGDFGPVTTEATRRFQQANGIGVDGIVGHDTYARAFPV